MDLLDLKSSILREVSAYSRDPKAVLFHLAKFLLEALKLDSSFLFPFPICAHNYLFNHNLTFIKEYEFLPFIFNCNFFFFLCTVQQTFVLVYIPGNYRSPELSYLPSFYFLVRSGNVNLLFNFTRPNIVVLAL